MDPQDVAEDHYLSVIVPIAPHDKGWSSLVSQLLLRQDSEVILSFCEKGLALQSKEINLAVCQGARLVVGRRGRARQLNAGAYMATGKNLWFLHADSQLTPGAVESLDLSLQKRPDGLHFFDLEFLADGPRLMGINAWGARVRSRWFSMPFGDQGFVCKRRTFLEMEGYKVHLDYGEDHEFVWRMRRQGQPVYAIDGVLRTSSRKYASNGWLTTTLRHLTLTYKQALPFATAQLVASVKKHTIAKMK